MSAVCREQFGRVCRVANIASKRIACGKTRAVEQAVWTKSPQNWIYGETAGWCAVYFYSSK